MGGLCGVSSHSHLANLKQRHEKRVPLGRKELQYGNAYPDRKRKQLDSGLRIGALTSGH